MALQKSSNLFHIFGLVAWGDIAELTMYKSKRGKVVVFHKSYPEGPPSDNQAHWRTRFANASTAWLNLSLATKQKWETVTKRLSLSMTGYDLFLSWQLAPDLPTMRTLERQSGITLLA